MGYHFPFWHCSSNPSEATSNASENILKGSSLLDKRRTNEEIRIFCRASKAVCCVFIQTNGTLPVSCDKGSIVFE